MTIIKRKRCDFYWGSHGCDLSRDHSGVHKCLGCSEFEETGAYEGGKVRYRHEGGGWSEWIDTHGFRMRLH